MSVGELRSSAEEYNFPESDNSQFSSARLPISFQKTLSVRSGALSPIL